MNQRLEPFCTLCGREKRFLDQAWLLLVPNCWEDKVRVFEWDEELARRKGVHCACSPAHTEELVIHWMITGSLNYPFASVGHSRRRRPTPRACSRQEAVDTSHAIFIGELAVDRESVERTLSEHPGSLGVVLEELRSALDKKAAQISGLSDLEDEESTVACQLVT
jgi:hypothetical protein